LPSDPVVGRADALSLLLEAYLRVGTRPCSYSWRTTTGCRRIGVLLAADLKSVREADDSGSMGAYVDAMNEIARLAGGVS
jgi:hypothetical protein